MTKDTIARLREELEVCGCDPDECMMCQVPSKVKTALDEIEAQYMRLPVDAEGVPIRPGDKLCEGTAARVCIAANGEHSVYVTRVLPNVLHEFECHEVSHVKPETVEGLLEEFGAMFEAETDDIMPLVRDYAERIRKAVEHEQG